MRMGGKRIESGRAIRTQERPTVTKMDIKTRNSLLFSRCSASGALERVPWISDAEKLRIRTNEGAEGRTDKKEENGIDADEDEPREEESAKDKVGVDNVAPGEEE